MTSAEVASAFYRRQQLIAGATGAAALAAWSGLSADDLDGSWAAGVERRILSALVAGQLASAVAGQGYVSAVVREQGVDPDPAGALNPRSLVGVGADGVPLPLLARLGLVRAKQEVGAGRSRPEALAAGGRRLAMMAVTETQDAGRNAVAVAQVADARVTGWIRQTSGPTCPRCAVLAGRVYRWSQGFDRHPRDDCVSVPVTDQGRARALTQDAAALFRAGRVRGLTQAESSAVESGADMGQVVNARSGMYVAGGRKFTTAGTVRGTARGRVRPAVAQVMREAGDDRAEAVRLLQRHGYIT